MSSEVEEHIGAAALLHDVTHAPFGHTLEDERRLFPRHDKGARLQQLLAGDLGALLQRLGCLDSVKGILGAGQESSPRWMQLIISGTVDADMLDYLRRDSYHAGLAQAYDDRVFNYFLVEDDQLALQMTKHGMEQPDARSEIVQLLRMRYFLTERIYYHHTKVVAGAMVSKAVEIAQEHGALREAEVQQLTDATLFQHLASVPRAKNPDPRLKRLVAALEQRRLLKRGYVLSPLTVPMEERARLVERFHLDGAARRKAEEQIVSSLGCNDEEVILYCPALSVMKEAAALVRMPSGLRRLNQADDGPLSEIRALEERYAQLWRFYLFVPREHTTRAAEIGREMFGFASEHRDREAEELR